VKTGSHYDVPFRRYMGACPSTESADNASNVRADSKHVGVFSSELGSHY